MIKIRLKFEAPKILHQQFKASFESFANVKLAFLQIPYLLNLHLQKKVIFLYSKLAQLLLANFECDSSTLNLDISNKGFFFCSTLSDKNLDLLKKRRSDLPEGKLLCKTLLFPILSFPRIFFVKCAPVAD